MNFRGALTVVQRGLRWQIILHKCFAPEFQLITKTVSADFSSLASKISFVPTINILCSARRDYAIKKSVKKKGKDGKTAVSLTGLGELIDVDQMVGKMEEAVENMKAEFIKSLSLRSSGSIEALKVKFEGKEYELQQIAKITRKGQQTVVVDMLSFPQMTKAVVDTLKTSALNLNPQQEATTIFVPIPKVTKEHREVLAKKAKAIFITYRDVIKQIREENVNQLKDSGPESSETQSAIKQVRALGDNYIAQAESTLKAKQEELIGK